MGINLVQDSSQEAPPYAVSSACRFETSRIDLNNVKFSAQSLRLTSRPGHMESLYALGLRAPRNLKISQDGSLTIVWDKACQEKAVGAIFSGVNGLDVAVVSVFSPNAECRDAKTTENGYRVKGMTVASGKKINGMTKEALFVIGQRFNFNFSLLPLSSLKVSRRGAGDAIAATAVPTCLESVGLVVGEDSLGNLAMASLVGGGDKICNVAQISSASPLLAPIVGPAVGPMPKVFGLKIFGTAIN
jgi:hypothetical protein